MSVLQRRSVVEAPRAPVAEEPGSKAVDCSALTLAAAVLMEESPEGADRLLEQALEINPRESSLWHPGGAGLRYRATGSMSPLLYRAQIAVQQGHHRS